MKKRLLILGAMEMHVPLIERAKTRGIHTITCDYLPDNPGHKIADEAYFDSTTDLHAVLALAERLKIDGIMTYNSDPAAPTVAYVAEKLNLPGNPYKAVKIMSEKDLFRSFLKSNGLNFPKYQSCNENSNWRNVLDSIGFSVIVKPVDSSGSKGCTVLYSPIDAEYAITTALENSRCKRYVIEEYIVPQGSQLHGDGFVKEGVLEFLWLGDHHFDEKINGLVPFSTTYPSIQSKEIISSCHSQIQSFISKVGFRNGGINVELRVSTKNCLPYIIDIGARNGGNFTPKVIEYATNFNFLDAAISLAINEPLPVCNIHDNGFFSYLILHSVRTGVFKNLVMSEEIQKRCIEAHIYAKENDKIDIFTGANTALGVLIMKYESKDIMKKIVDNFDKLYTIELLD